MNTGERLWTVFAALLCACGPGAASGGDASDAEMETSTGSPLADLPGDLPGDLPEDPVCDCGPGTTCVIYSSDICSIGCAELPPSCGDAPSCDPACQWDLCKTVDCQGIVSSADTLCSNSFDAPMPVDAWLCSTGFGPCNLWLEDCPEGEKCRPTDGGGPEPGWWTTSSCAIPGAAAVGQPCVRDNGVYAGDDDCELGAICWDVDEISGEGTCVPLCTGAPHEPLCPGDSRCALLDPMWAAVCLPPCDPLGGPIATPCGPAYTCAKVGDTLACLPERVAPANLGETCERANDCAPGLACVEGGQIPGCAGERCCTPFCSLAAPACPAQTPSCAPALAQAPAELADVGLCLAP